MKISNYLPLSHIAHPMTRKSLSQDAVSIQTQQKQESFQRAFAAHAIISEAHQLVTMAINVSYELINKAHSASFNRTDMLARLSTINNYFSRLSPGTANLPNIALHEITDSSSSLVFQLYNAAQSDDSSTFPVVHNNLLTNKQLLDNIRQGLSMQNEQMDNTVAPDIKAITDAIVHDDAALRSHNVMRHERIAALLS